MTVITETAFAKINLALHVRARRDDGYHLLETLFAFVDQGDEITVKDAARLSLSLSGPLADGLEADDDNLVLRAARAMQVHFGVTRGADIHLEKRLPIAAGLGGGSADAAAVARALNRLWGVQADDDALIAAIGSLGADVAVCVASQTVIGRGIGDEMSRWSGAEALRGQPVLLVNPSVPCPTGPVFRRWDGVDHGPLTDDPAAWRNDLEAGAIALVPPIADVLNGLGALPDTHLVRMSGSGATCFALFRDGDARDYAARVLAAQYPHWWIMAGVLR